MIEICNYINSKDIRKYLKSIDYKFNIEEAVWILWHSYQVYYKDKIKLLRECKKEFDNIQFKCGYDKIKSYYSLIDEYAKLIEEISDKFFSGKLFDKSYYTYDYITENDNCFNDYLSINNHIIYESFDKCRIDSIENESDNDGKVIYTKICERQFNTNNSVCAIFNKDGLCVDFSISYLHGISDIKEEIYDCLSGIYLKFPTPFKSGDIIKIIPHEENLELSANPIIYICNTNVGFGDYTDMRLEGYAIHNNKVSFETFGNYMDAEYYIGQECEDERYKLISLAVQNNIDFIKLGGLSIE